MKHLVYALLARSRQHRFFGLLAKAFLTLLAFWLAARDIDRGQMLHIWQSQNHLLLLFCVLLVLAQISFGAFRWHLILLATAHKKVISALECCRIYYISVFFNCCLPGTIGGDVVRVLLAKSDHVPTPLAVNSVLIDRIIALFALGLLVLATLPMLADYVNIHVQTLLMLSVALAVVGVYVVYRLEHWIGHLRHIKLVDWLLYFSESIRTMMRMPAMSLLSLFYAWLAHISYCLGAYFLAQSLTIDISVTQCITLLPWVMLAIILPLSIGGWGVREAGMVTVLSIIGVPKAAALMLSVQLGLIGILISLPGGVLWLLHKRPKAPALPSAIGGTHV